MPQTIQLRPNLFLLTIANQADSRTIQQLLEQTNAVECLNYLPAPNADIWQFRFQNADLTVCNDSAEGLDIRFTQPQDQAAAEQLAQTLFATWYKAA
ncbi:hypothetical protein [Kingella oralis]|uniref:hypothetical protein n=1 Tax=Kingella oralis TaxID=505 RepID=UPI0028E7DC29|nr:hypothetical protein [Kingella oralis]